MKTQGLNPFRPTQVVGDVPKGSSVRAGHSVYVTGNLLGKAVAGVSGDKRSRVFAVRAQRPTHDAVHGSLAWPYDVSLSTA